MSIGGIIISVRPEDRQETEILLGRIGGLTMYSCDEQGNIIARVSDADADAVRETIERISALELVRGVRLAYLVHGDGSVTDR